MSEPKTERPSEPVPTKKISPRGIGLAALIAGVALGLVGVYGIGGFEGNVADAGKCRASSRTAARLTPFAIGDVAAFAPAAEPASLSHLAFARPDGTPTTLAAWHGRTVLLNLWATWCVPCRKEMPALDRLQSAAGSADFEVVAVNVDTRDPDRPKTFLDEIGVKTLARYTDPGLALFKDLQRAGLARGLPTTILIDAEGCELGVMAGPAEWDGRAARALIDAAGK